MLQYVQSFESCDSIYSGIDSIVFDRLLGLPFWFRARGTVRTRYWASAACSRHLGHDHLSKSKDQAAACRGAAHRISYICNRGGMPGILGLNNVCHCVCICGSGEPPHRDKMENAAVERIVQIYMEMYLVGGG